MQKKILNAEEEQSKHKFLLNIVKLEKVDHASIARTFKDSISLLESFNKNKILLYLTFFLRYLTQKCYMSHAKLMPCMKVFKVTFAFQPCITRWGTWLQAVEYYAKNFEEFKDVVNNFNENNAVAIKK